MQKGEMIDRVVETYKEKMIALQRDLTAIPAISPVSGGKGETKKSDFLVKYLKHFGFRDVEVVSAGDPAADGNIRPNIIAKLEYNESQPTVWILSHMDVVPPGELSLWKTDPYKLEVKDGKIYGRGTEDNQQAVVASIFAAKYFIDSNITPAYNIGLAIVADEETGSDYGVTYLLKKRPDLFRKDDLIIVPDSGSADGANVEIAEKSILWLKVKTIGQQGHAARPHLAKNAFKAAANLIVKLEQLYKEYDAQDPIFNPPYSTFEPTKKENNVPNVNTIPGEDIFYVDCRVLAEYSLENVLTDIKLLAAQIEKQYQVKIELTPVNYGQAAPATSKEAPVVKAVCKGIRDVYKVEPKLVGIGGNTVAAIIRNAGFNVAVWSKIAGTAHQSNEFCVIDNMAGDAKVFARIIAGV